MSRSQKHTPVAKNSRRSGGKRFLLRLANRRVRRFCGLASGGAYRKAFCSYNICDYRFHETLDEYLRMEREVEARYGTAPAVSDEE